MADDLDQCDRAGWCCLDPGHESDCQLIRPVQLAALQKTIEDTFDELGKVMVKFLAAAGLIAERTRKDFTLCPDPEENPDDKPAS